MRQAVVQGAGGLAERPRPGDTVQGDKRFAIDRVVDHPRMRTPLDLLLPCVASVAMRIVRQVVVFDAANLHAESAFWAGVLDGRVLENERWHTVIDSAGQWRIGVQLAPGHVPPGWPNGSPQQVHLDLHVEDPRVAHRHVCRSSAHGYCGPLPTWKQAKGSC